MIRMGTKEPDWNDPVGIPEIATLFGVARNTVDQWRSGRRGNGFPDPDFTVGGRPAWRWGTIRGWDGQRDYDREKLDHAVRVHHLRESSDGHSWDVLYDGTQWVAHIDDGGNTHGTAWALGTDPAVDAHLNAAAFGATPQDALRGWLAHKLDLDSLLD